MKSFPARIIQLSILTTSLFLPCFGLLAQTTAVPKTSTSSASSAAPSSQEIADAKAKGLVWVNTSTHVYHKEGNFYGTTKHGKFMTEDDAMKAGYRAAKTPGSGKKAGAVGK